MKIIKFFVTVVIIIIICGILPIYLFNITQDISDFYVSVDGTNLKGIPGYNSKIALNPSLEQEIKNDVAKMYELSGEIIEYKNNTYNILVLYMVISQNILLIILGVILLKKTDYKSISKAIITGATICIIIFLFMFITTKMMNVIL